TDSKGAAKTVSCSITITHKYQVACPQASGTAGVAYSSGVTVTGGTGLFAFSVTAGSLPPGLSINPSTGVISGTPSAAGPYSVTIRVTDSSTVPSPYEETSCSITIAVTATCPANLTAIAGQAYSASMAGFGGVAPYTFSNAVGLPANLTMSSAGVISGTALAVGTYSFTVSVRDANGSVGTASCTLTVRAAPSASCAAISAIQGAPITAVKLTGTGGVGGPYTFDATGLPAGLTMAADGTISGTPTVNGTFNYTVTVTDKDGNTGTFTCSITVNPPITADSVSLKA